jgi:rubrerythrin
MFPEPLFWTFFILIFILAIISYVISLIRSMKSTGKGQWQNSETQQTIKEREIIREIVKIRCPYCNNLYDESEDKCPHCGGTKS